MPTLFYARSQGLYALVPSMHFLFNLKAYFIFLRFNLTWFGKNTLVNNVYEAMFDIILILIAIAGINFILVAALQPCRYALRTFVELD